MKSLRIFDALFDVLYSRNPFGTVLTAPMRTTNRDRGQNTAYTADTYAVQLKDTTGTLVTDTYAIQLKDTTGTLVTDTYAIQLKDTTGTLVTDTYAVQLKDTTGTLVADTYAIQLKDTTGTLVTEGKRTGIVGFRVCIRRA